MRIRGLRDIKTHSSLAQEGKLIGVARNLHRMSVHKSESGNISNDWSVERHIYPKQKPVKPRLPAMFLHRYPFLENKIRLYQIEIIQDFLKEMRQALAEEIPVSMREFERLTKKLAELETE